MIKFIKRAGIHLVKPAKSKEMKNHFTTYLEMIEACEIQDQPQKLAKQKSLWLMQLMLAHLSAVVFFKEQTANNSKEQTLLTASSREWKGAKATHYY